jgi:hypothetical protein
LGQLAGPLPQRLIDGFAQLVLSLGDGRSTQFLAEDHVEGRDQLARGLALVAEQQALEERHIELSSQMVVGLAVGGGAVAASRQGTGEVGLAFWKSPSTSAKRPSAFAISRVRRSCSLLSRSSGSVGPDATAPPDRLDGRHGGRPAPASIAPYPSCQVVGIAYRQLGDFRRCSASRLRGLIRHASGPSWR